MGSLTGAVEESLWLYKGSHHRSLKQGTQLDEFNGHGIRSCKMSRFWSPLFLSNRNPDFHQGTWYPVKQRWALSDSVASKPRGQALTPEIRAGVSGASILTSSKDSWHTCSAPSPSLPSFCTWKAEAGAGPPDVTRAVSDLEHGSHIRVKTARYLKARSLIPCCLSCQLWISHLWASLTWERNKPFYSLLLGVLCPCSWTESRPTHHAI